MINNIRTKYNSVKARFVLPDGTKDELKRLTPDFGFGGLGEVVFRRTYSRNGESWADVVIRVIEGVMSLRKDHYEKNSLGWKDSDHFAFAHGMAISMFKMEWLPPGRGLWMGGTDFVYERGSMALNNCGAYDTEYDLVHAAEWVMDALMNGVGTGFSTSWRGTALSPDKNDVEKIRIADSREGWVDSLISLMTSYTDSPKYGKSKFPEFDYTDIRGPGVPIKGFGGTSSGPEPLIKMHKRIEGYFDAFCAGELVIPAHEDYAGVAQPEAKKPYSHTRLIADIFNSIGACIVAGNVRRCLPGDALVHTDRGLVPIKDVSLGDHVLTMDGYESVSNTFEQGLQSLVEIKTQDGGFKCTPNHKMAVCTSYERYEWVEARNLKSGDRLLTSRSILDGSESVLPAWTYEHPAHSTTCKDLSIPELDEDMAWLIGLFQGDGYTYANHAGFGSGAYVSIVGATEYYDILEKAKTQLQRFGDDLNITLKKRKGENSFILHCQSKQLAWYMHQNVIQPMTVIRTPAYIMEARSSIRLAYAAGVCDADGSLKGVMTTVYKEFAEDVQNILYASGITSRLKETTQYTSRPIYTLNLITARSKLDFTNIPELNKEAPSLGTRSQNANGFPTSFEDNARIKTTFGLRQAAQFNIDAYDRQYGECDYTPTEVLEVIPLTGEVETYDIEVANRHEFFCNGYLTHNSAEISLGDADDNDFINLKNYDMNPERAEIGWMSNNSVRLKADGAFEDFSYIPDMAKRIIDNGEPGLINIYNIQKYGRFGKESPDEAQMCNPCGEIPLVGGCKDTEGKPIEGGGELCNLAEVFPHRCDGLELFNKSLEYATFYATSVSLLPTHRPETNAIIARNRRIGVSISGIAQWVEGAIPASWGNMNYTRLTRILRDGYRIVKTENVRLAREAGVPPSIRVTTIKPSGSISLLAGATPGVHYPVSRYAIRRVRIGVDSPLVPGLIAAGIPNEKDTYTDNTLVFEFAIDHGDVRPCDQVSPWEQFNLVAMLQRCWADNMVSATVYFDKVKDAPDVEKMLAMFIPVLKSVSMLPHSGHGYAQAPYEGIDKDAYEKRRSGYTTPDFDSVVGNVPAGSKFCDGDTCTL